MHKAVLAIFDQHFGALVAIVLGIYLIIAYTRGELGGLFSFAKEMLSGADGRASTKSVGYFAGIMTLCWSFVKVTLATCRRIDAGMDPSMVFVAELAVIATLVGAGYLFGKYLTAKSTSTPPPPDAQEPQP